MRRLFARMAPALILVSVLAPASAGASPGGQTGAQKARAGFDALIARVKQSDEAVSFLQLRRLFAESDAYTPYRDDAEESMIAAVVAERHQEALTIARGILARNYMNIEAHFTSAISCTALRDTACTAHHMYVARGLIESIRASGDGKAPATAFVVVNTPEEYALLKVLGARVESQSLMRSDDGHSFDVLTVQDGSGQRRNLYFNVDLAMAAMSRLFGLK